MKFSIKLLPLLFCLSTFSATPFFFGQQVASSGGGWTPTTPSNTLLWWIDASDSSTTFQNSGLSTPATANNDPVGGLKDKSSNAKNATQATSGFRPLLKTADKNGKNTLLFDGVDDYLQSATWTVSAQPWTVFIVFQYLDNTGRPIFSGVSKRNLLGAGLTTFRIYADTGADFANTTVNEDANWHIAKIVFNGASSTFAFDGAADTTFAASPGTGGSEGVTMGAYETLNLWGNVKIAEMFIYASTVSSGDSTSAFSYLNTKWAVY